MSDAFKFKLNRRGFGEFMRSAEMRAEMVRRAEKIKARAIVLAPVGRNDRTIGAAKGASRYKDSFKVSSGTRHTGQYDADLEQTFKSSRAYARVENSKPYAVFVEYGRNRKVKDKDGKVTGTEHVQGHRVLGRAIDAAGD